METYLGVTRTDNRMCLISKCVYTEYLQQFFYSFHIHENTSQNKTNALKIDIFSTYIFASFIDLYPQVQNLDHTVKQITKLQNILT